MKEKSKRTKKLKAWNVILTLFSLALWIAPIAYCISLSIIQSNFLYQKVALSMSILAVVIMTIVAAVNKIALRCRLWVLLLGVYVALKSIMTPLIIIACCQIVDELIICPIKSRVGEKLRINREIDRRIT